MATSDSETSKVSVSTTIALQPHEAGFLPAIFTLIHWLRIVVNSKRGEIIERRVEMIMHESDGGWVVVDLQTIANG